MPELWFGPDRDPDSVPPILPMDALEALKDVDDRVGRQREWTPTAMGFAAEPDTGDALAGAMAGLHLDDPFPSETIVLDDLLDPWAMEAEAFPSYLSA
jgi:hypothetical protein